MCEHKMSPTKRRLCRLNEWFWSGLYSCFRCTNDGCGATFSSHAARKAHEKRHAGWSISLRRGPASSICNSLIKTGLQLYLHVTFSHPWKQFWDKCAVGSRRDAESSEWPFPLILAAYGSVHAGYRCPHADCPALAYTWGKLQKHVAKHPGRCAAAGAKTHLTEWVLLLCSPVHVSGV